MIELKRLALLTLVFAVLSLLAMVASHLALTDIGHGEGNLVQEWAVVRIGFLVVLAFHASTVITLIRLLQFARGPAT